MIEIFQNKILGKKNEINFVCTDMGRYPKHIVKSKPQGKSIVWYHGHKTTAQYLIQVNLIYVSQLIEDPY